MSEETHKTRWLWLAAIVILLVAAAVTVVSLAQKQEDPFVVQIADELQLRFHTIISYRTPLDDRTWDERLYDASPEFVREHVISFFYSREYSWTSGATSTPGTIQVLFTPELRGMGNPSFTKDNIKTVEAKLKKRRHFLRLNYGDSYSWPLPVALVHKDSRGGKTVYFYGAEVNNVPVTARSFKLEILKNVGAEGRELAATKPLANPIYSAIKPLSGASPLPVSVADNGVTVTLTKLLYNVNYIPDAYAPRGARPDWVDGGFTGGSKDPADVAYSVIIFNTESADANANWGVGEIGVRYGDNNIPLWLEPTKPAELQSLDGLLQMFKLYDANIGAFGQPVKVEARLVKRGEDFSAEDLFTVDMALPTTGTFSRTGTKGLPKAGGATVYAGNRRAIPGFGTLLDSDTMVVKIKGVDQFSQVVDAMVTAADSTTATLNDRRRHNNKPYQDDVLNVDYDVALRMSGSSRSPLDISQFTTLTLTVAVPPQMGKVFEFIATPQQPPLAVTPK